MTKQKDKPTAGEERLAKLERALEKAEAKLSDQSARLDKLGTGREESMRLLAEARADLARVGRERDQLQRRLAAIEGMQTETIALPEEEKEGPSLHEAPPSIDELMAGLNSVIEERASDGHGVRFNGPAAEAADSEWQEMIAPELIAPEEFGGESDSDRAARATRLLVYMDAAHPIKYPLFKEVMTIGRGESADIQIDGEFISRVHARIVCKPDATIIEDVGSKNGFKVNSKPVERTNLKHGDMVAIGKLMFTFVNTADDA